MPTLKILFHDNCFDGAASAAVFADFYRQHIARDATVALHGMQHRLGDPFAGVALDADDNVCVDFRYTTSDRLTWWFDHHVSAFQPPRLRAHFEADDSGQKFYDPQAKSCTRLIVDSLAAARGYELPARLAELVHWAHIIDGAQFESARAAVDLSAPAMQLMTWLEHNTDAARTHELINSFGAEPLGDIVRRPWIREPLGPVLAQHERNIGLVAARAACDDGVVAYDLVDDGAISPNKFISYHLFDEARYTVALTRGDDTLKISVGYNPWSHRERAHNIASICERYGGGGHPVVGAVALPIADLHRARQIFQEIRTELAG